MYPRARVLLALLSLASFSLSNASQLPLNPAEPAMSASEAPLSAGEPTLYDLIMIERRTTIFGDYLRKLTDVAGRLNDRSTGSTVLVPTNKAVLALARKPHQGPPPSTDSVPDGEIGISEEQLDKADEENVRNWVSSHIIPQHPISLSSEETFPTLHDGTNVHFTSQKNAAGDWEHYLLYPDVKIVNQVEAANGVIYVIEGTVEYY
ncbi:hypothetical protein DL93DRAFT_2083604 [Clavulina sp. PMI_390]|nr:hypothetical protein DL93DRAFT_2083604 [Clavulina sp. PMI_390]